MPVNEELWCQHQYSVLVSYVRHLSYRKVLSNVLVEMKSKNEFWVQTTDAHLFRSVIDWCMIFGANNSAIHWKRVVNGSADQEDLRQHLLRKSDQEANEWDSYWKSMISFRNGYAAHRAGADQYPTVPFMDKSLQVAVAYDNWIRTRLNTLVLDPSIESSYMDFMRTMPCVLKRLVELTTQVEYECSNQNFEGQL